jgi:hypothetical protein
MNADLVVVAQRVESGVLLCTALVHRFAAESVNVDEAIEEESESSAAARSYGPGLWRFPRGNGDNY